MELDLVDVSRWQFGITTVYHFIFVPLTIGLAPLVAAMQTVWHITGRDHWYRATRFFGVLFLINFAMGVVTGIVQEFQFGMNWSEYSRFVGDVFGAPLALEGLAAFFIESIFLGVWIFGWGRVPKILHLLSIWMVAIAVNVSAYFIIVANSFMQRPTGAAYNPETGRAELIDIGELLTNPIALTAFPHAVAGAFLVSGTFIAGISAFWMVRTRLHAAQQADISTDDAVMMWRPLLRMGLWVIILSVIGLTFTGDLQAKLMFEYQPMKMASAEALCHTEEDPWFSILAISTFNNCDSVTEIFSVPWVLPFLAAGSFTGVTLQGVTDLQAHYETLYGPGNYTPNLFVTYWSFRLMIGLMAVSLIVVVLGFWLTRRGRISDNKWFAWGALAAIPFPFLSNSFGWIFTEMGRQPWIVHPNISFGPDAPNMENEIHMIVDFGVSNHSIATVWTSLISFTLIYGALAVVWFWLMRRHTLAGPLPVGASENIVADTYGPQEQELEPLSFSTPTSGTTTAEKEK